MVTSPLIGLGPMLAQKTDVDLSTLVGTHVFDEKLDGLRAMVVTDGDRVWLRGRNGQDLLPHFPEIESGARVVLRDGVVLDGEITTTTFEDVNHRAMMSAQRIRTQRTKLPMATFNAFDVLHCGNDTRHLDWWTRRSLLTTLDLNGRFRATRVSPLPSFFDEIKAEGGEGVIAKRLGSRYMAGRSRDWLKFKATHRVTCIAFAYLPGTGTRGHFGAIEVAMIDDTGTVQKVGKAGSGFTDRTIAEVKAHLDNHQPVLVEIECLGLTSGGQLRQPVFKGVRSDLTLLDARTTQLQQLPKG